MKNILIILILSFSLSLFSQAKQALPSSGPFAAGLPEKGKDGACYALCSKKPVYKEELVKVLVKPEFKRIKIIPAEYKTVVEKVVVKPASKKFIYIPATYKTEKVSYVAKPASNSLSKVPEEFKRVQKTIEVKPKTGSWIVSEDKAPNCESADPNDCKIIYYLEQEAEVKKYSIQEKVKDETVNKTPVPEETDSYEIEVQVSPAKVEEVPIPEIVEEVTKVVLVKDETTEEEVVPAVYETIKTNVLVSDSSVSEWRQVPCKVDKEKIRTTPISSSQAPEPTNVKPKQMEQPKLATVEKKEVIQYEALPVFYKLGSPELTPESRKVIDEKLYNLLVGRPDVKVMIMSHTDSRGTPASNLSLSKQRAKSVVDYLIEKGIKASRLSSEGYGETQLLNDCKDGVKCSEEEHQKNRRTEFKILE
jgi:OmpA-OmpF porin, OOP family